MGRPKKRIKKISYSISIDEQYKDYHCQAFNGSLTHTFRFLAMLMDDACRDGMLDSQYVAEKLREYKTVEKLGDV